MAHTRVGAHSYALLQLIDVLYQFKIRWLGAKHCYALNNHLSVAKIILIGTTNLF